MYPSIPDENLKSPAPSAPPYNQPPATGIPVIPPPSSSYTQPHQYQIPSGSSAAAAGKWSTGLCGCCSDCSTCCMTCVCPCVTFGQVAEIIDKGSTPCVFNAGIYGLICMFTGCACVYSSFYRTKMRKQYMLPERPCPDFLVHFCCECCALCQEHRHLKSLGFDLSIGWRGNMEKQNLGPTMSPVVNPRGMIR